MNKNYIAPEVEIIKLTVEDVIRTSVTADGDNDYDIGGLDQNQ